MTLADGTAERWICNSLETRLNEYVTSAARKNMSEGWREVLDDDDDDDNDDDFVEDG